MEKITFKSAWENCEKKFSLPTWANKIKIINYKEFKKKVLDENINFVNEITTSLFNGDSYILKGAYSKEFMMNLREKTFSHFKDKPSQFYKTLEDSPDFPKR